MKGYAEQEIFTTNEIDFLRRATELVAVTPYTERITNKPIRCHELARAVAAELGLKWSDGIFGAVEHTWLLLPHQKHRIHSVAPRVLDVYVPGALPQVQIVDTYQLLPYRYLPTHPRTDINDEIVEWLRLRVFRGHP